MSTHQEIFAEVQSKLETSKDILAYLQSGVSTEEAKAKLEEVQLLKRELGLLRQQTTTEIKAIEVNHRERIASAKGGLFVSTDVAKAKARNVRDRENEPFQSLRNLIDEFVVELDRFILEIKKQTQ